MRHSPSVNSTLLLAEISAMKRSVDNVQDVLDGAEDLPKVHRAKTRFDAECAASFARRL